MELTAGGGEYVFAGQRPGGHLSDTAMKKVMRRMKVDATVHGFRSAFRDWAAETTTDFASDVVEMAHTIPNAVERAYRRGNLLEKRRALMDAWAQYGETSSMRWRRFATTGLSKKPARIADGRSSRSRSVRMSAEEQSDVVRREALLFQRVDAADHLARLQINDRDRPIVHVGQIDEAVLNIGVLIAR
jgi:hypothetical protein